MARIVTFGEIMGRLATPGHLRFQQADALEITYGGSEANVAVSVAVLGGEAAYVTALPANALGDACRDRLRGLGVDCSGIVRDPDGRLGLYFLESGANQRPSNVIYDRAESAICKTPADAYNWSSVLSDADWLHISGITPATSRAAAEATLAAAKEASSQGLTVSCDLNFRKKLWKWDPSKTQQELAEATMRGILPYVNVVIANEEDCSDVLGIQADATDVDAGVLNTGRYPDVARKVVEQFDSIKKVAITLRESISASHNNWGGMLYDAEKKAACFAPLDKDGNYTPYQIKNIVDRVGGGDSFAAGLIFALTTPELQEPQSALAFAVAASCLAHSITGDFNFSSRAEVEKLMGGSGSGRVVR